MRAHASAIAAVLIVLCTVLLLPPGRADAAELVTDYPVISVRPGDTATFGLRVLAPQRERVDLQVTEAPLNWAVRILGGGRQVGAVTADPDAEQEPTIDLEIDVPVDAAPGNYPVTVSGSSPSGVVTLPLQLIVTDLAAAPFELTADFPELSGGPDQTFTFDVDVANNTGRDATFSVEATGPSGWSVDARPADQAQATTLTVTGGGSGTLRVTATPPPDTAEGRYPIDVRITTDDTPVEGQFTAVVIGTPQLVFQAADERLSLSAEAGSASTFALLVGNEGSAALNDVTLSASAPTDWTVTFEPTQIAQVEPGASIPVTATIEPRREAIAGDYALTMTATATDANASLDVRAQVKTSTWWGFIAVAIIVVALGALAFVFRRFGRR